MKKSSLYLTRAAMIAALYVALTYLSFALGISSGAIQFRLSEALCILPIFMPCAVIGLSVGCLIANIFTGAAIWDMIFGTLATFIGAVGARLLRSLPKKLLWLATLPTVIANAITVPLVLIYAYGAEDAYLFILLTVTLGELVCASVLGTILCLSLKKTRGLF